jgi:DNA-binding SARP family transcriptional activator
MSQTMARATTSATRTASLHLSLMRGFDFSLDGRSVSIPVSSQRIVAMVALRDRPAIRSQLAETLWMDASEDRAMGNLRSALWRLRQTGCEIVETLGERVGLSRRVVVDVHTMASQARQMHESAQPPSPSEVDSLVRAGSLLPEWQDEWVLIDRERLRQVRLHALERACERLTANGRYGEAIDAGLAAIAEEPLHESAHRLLILAHLAEGNRVEATRQFQTYAATMWADLRLEPSPEICSLMDWHPARLATSG